MDRINKFLNSRQEKHKKTVKYKDEKFIITKEDLKKVRSYKSGKCLDPSIKSVPNRKLDYTSEPIEAFVKEKKKDMSDYHNKRLRDYYLSNPKPKVIEVNKNEIVDIWEDENIEDLKSYVQEWTYSITEQYTDKIENLKFTKDHLEDELRRIHLNQFRPRDTKSKPIREILPKLPNLDSMRPYPEHISFEWPLVGKKIFFNSICCSIENKRILVQDLKFNKTIVDYDFEVEIIKVAYSNNKIIVAGLKTVFFKDLDENKPFKPIITMDKGIKDIYLDATFIGILTSRSIHLYDLISYEELKILKLKGDTPHSIKIINNFVYASTHKGIMIESEERSEVKNLGYVIDFDVDNNSNSGSNTGSIYAINNLGRLITIDSSLQICGSTVQSGIGSQIKLHPKYKLLAILFYNEIALYKIINDKCIPLDTINGSFKSLSWHEEMPWLYAAQKSKIVLFT